ncbi:MAG: phosphatidylinositol-binding protein scs2 [Vezdaea acicularis]|nr:MAG: phosphatidylinositol-binding protein scs2 [Vezdaea acicularis]
MSVELIPQDLGFRRPFTSEVSQTLRLKNPTNDPVAFKVCQNNSTKTVGTPLPYDELNDFGFDFLQPRYCVRPNSGRIEAGKEVEVQVLLQAMKEDPPLDTKCRDKFLVQTVAVTADKEFSNVAQIVGGQAVPGIYVAILSLTSIQWQHVEATSRQAIKEQKIRVVFLPATSSTPTTNHVGNGPYADHEAHGATSEPPAYNSSPQYNTPARSVPSGPVSKPESRPSESKSLGQIKDSATNPATGSSGSGIAIPTTLEEYKAEVARLKEQILGLTKKADEGLRQRVKSEPQGIDPSEPNTSTTASAQLPTEGVPLQITAALCLLSFLLAYLFF